MNLDDRLAEARYNLRAGLDPKVGAFDEVLERRQRSRARARAAIGAGIVVLVAAIAIPTVALHRGPTTTLRSTKQGPANSGVTPVAPAGATVPGCTQALTTAPVLGSIRTSEVSDQGSPFGVQISPDGRWGFLSVPGVASESPSSIDVFSISSGQAVLERAIPAPPDSLGEFLTADGRYLLVASGSGASVFDVQRAEAGSAGALLGTLGGGPQDGAWEVTATSDDRYVFVTYNETGLGVTVFNLAEALRKGFGPSNAVGTVSTGGAEGVGLSPNGKWLYATTTGDALVAVPTASAEQDPRNAHVASVVAGCFPNRVIVSPDGSTVWVTASGSNALLGFSAAKVQSGDVNALTAEVGVGALPVAMAIVDHGERMVVADANWTAYQKSPATPPIPDAVSELSVVSLPEALAGRPALLGTISSGTWPRDLAYSATNQTLLVANSASNEMETVTLTGLP